MWIYEGKEFKPDDELLNVHVGFVYLVTEKETGKNILEKKYFWKPKTYLLLKKEEESKN